MQELAVHIHQLSPSSVPCSEMAPGSSSSIAGDHIGLESCLDMVKIGELDQLDDEGAAKSMDYCFYSDRVQQRREQRWEMRRKEYPPPIPLLARTENLSCHMPWVLRRYYTSDGRLILREEKVRHHEYLRAHRADGRLTLHLVPMDDVDFTIPSPASCVEEVEGDEQKQLCFDDDDEKKRDGSEAEQIADAVNDLVIVSGGDDQYDGDINGDHGLVEEEGCGEHESEASVVVGKCLAYSVSGVGSSIFGVPISPIRPVHS